MDGRKATDRAGLWEVSDPGLPGIQNGLRCLVEFLPH